jgi:hypothetical protein
MRRIPLEAMVECADGPCGESGIVIRNLETRELTHFVVQDRALPDRDQRLVPFDQLVETSLNRVRMKCTKYELAAMDHFVNSHHALIHHEPTIDYPVDFAFRTVPRAALTEPWYASETVEHIPPGELVVGRATKAAARDGRVGHVSELVLDPESGHISHMVMEEGHLRGKEEVTVPVSAIDYLFEDTVYLKLDKSAIEQLPTVPVRRHYVSPEGGAG